MQRVHIINGTASGALLLELFTRDGVGTMIARFVPLIFLCSSRSSVYFILAMKVTIYNFIS